MMPNVAELLRDGGRKKLMKERSRVFSGVGAVVAAVIATNAAPANETASRVTAVSIFQASGNTAVAR
jgi:hypothetical protein